MKTTDNTVSKVASPTTASELLAADNLGTGEWWSTLKALKIPLVSANKTEESPLEKVRVDFFWQDPEGDETRSMTDQVILEVNSITNHHSWEPVSLKRITGTDVWHHALFIESNWSGSYSFIPLTQEQLPAIAREKSDGSSKAQRQWYMSIMHQAEADPLNLLPVVTAGRGGLCSALHMPGSQQSEAWQEWDQHKLSAIPREEITTFEWSSKSLNNTRHIWCFETGEKTAQVPKPLVILLDGQRWAAPSGTPSVLRKLTEQGIIAPAHYLLVDSIDVEIRWQELSCYEPFWQAVFDELLPLAKEHSDLPSLEKNMLVAGQSLGGLSSMYAGLHFPDYVNKVVSLSGSFWWPDVNRMKSTRSDVLPNTPPGSLAESVQLGQLNSAHLQVFQSVGSYEGDMNRYNEIMAASLEEAGCPVVYQQFCGGHDWLAWRSSLVEGLKALIPST